jgi:hypothetical protein
VANDGSMADNSSGASFGLVETLMFEQGMSFVRVSAHLSRNSGDNPWTIQAGIAAGITR